MVDSLAIEHKIGVGWSESQAHNLSRKPAHLPLSSSAEEIHQGPRGQAIRWNMKQPRNSITAEQLRGVLIYEPETGVFIRRVKSVRGKAKAGDLAGGQEANGYCAIWVLGIKYLAHRLAWLYITGEWPKEQIDHIDRNRSNNSFINLREATNSQNQFNVLRRSKFGLCGVSRNKNKWKAEIRSGGVKYHLGTFDTPEKAHEAYLAGKAKLHGESYV